MLANARLACDSARRLARPARILCLALAGLIVATATRAQSPSPTRFADRILMPWNPIGIDPEWRRQAKPALDAALADVQSDWIGSGVPLGDLAPATATLSSNLKRAADAARARSANAKPDRTLVVEPVWCVAGDRHVIAITVSDLDQDVLRAFGHQTIRRAPRGREGLTAPPAEAIRAATATAWRRASAMLQTSLARGKPDNALHVGLSLAAENTRLDEGSGQCLNLLLAGSLASDQTVLRPTGGEMFSVARNALGIAPQPRRATRRALARWEYPAHAAQSSPTFPLDMTVTLAWSEGVLGQPLTAPESTRYKIVAGEDGALAIQSNERLTAFLAEEKRALAFSGAPLIVKVQGAWAYVDRGRAWGLDIQDRLIARSPDGPVLGHVVRFFGPELGLRSSDGRVISEGAIIYVRKGQRLAKVGMTWDFDALQFATPWPPQPRAQLTSGSRP